MQGPTIGLDAPLVRRHGTRAPNNVRNAYWTSQSAVPGERGDAFVYGHTYDSVASGVGVFDHLGRLAPGQLIKVDMGNRVVTFKVRRVVLHARLNLSERAMAKLLSHLGTPRLTATTCLWSKAKHRYVSRVLVTATLVQG